MIYKALAYGMATITVTLGLFSVFAVFIGIWAPWGHSDEWIWTGLFCGLLTFGMAHLTAYAVEEMDWQAKRRIR